MYKYFFDQPTLLRVLLPIKLRLEHSFNFLREMLIPLDKIVGELDQIHKAKRYDMSMSCQIMYLEQLLNDKFNKSNLYPAITITDNLGSDEPAYMGNYEEEQAAIYLGNLWDVAVEYNAGDEVINKNLVWQCLQANSGNEPGLESEYWKPPTEPQEEVQFIGNIDGYNSGMYFIVNITTSNYAAIEHDAISAILNKHKLYGITYTYNIYDI